MTPRRNYVGGDGMWRREIVYPEGYKSEVETLMEGDGMPDPFEYGEALDSDLATDRHLYWTQREEKLRAMPFWPRLRERWKDFWGS